MSILFYCCWTVFSRLGTIFVRKNPVEYINFIHLFYLVLFLNVQGTKMRLSNKLSLAIEENLRNQETKENMGLEKPLNQACSLERVSTPSRNPSARMSVRLLTWHCPSASELLEQMQLGKRNWFIHWYVECLLRALDKRCWIVFTKHKISKAKQQQQ